MFDVFGRLFPGKKREVFNSAVSIPDVVTDVTSRVVSLSFDDGVLGTSIPDDQKSLLWNGRQESKMVLAHVLRKTRFEPLVEDIKQRFPNRQIGLRGVMTSLDGDHVVTKEGGASILVVDVSKTILSGTEKPGDDTVLIARVGDIAAMEELPDRVVQYLTQSASLVLGRTDVNRHLEDTLVPAILVYDISEGSGVVQVEGGYEHRLPEDPGKRAGVIIGVYPVDVRSLLPVTIKEASKSK